MAQRTGRTTRSFGRCRSLVALGAAVAVALACGRENDAGPELRVAVLATDTGTIARTSGIPTLEGARLAAAILNREGGVDIGGRRHRIRLVERDLPDQAELVARVTRRAIARDDVVAILGPQLSRDAIAAGNVAEIARVPLVSPMATSRRVSDGKRFTFRLSFDDERQGDVMATFARQTLRARTAAVLYDVASEYNRSIAEVFMRSFAAAGGRVVAEERYTTDQAGDFRPQLERIRDARPDVLFLPNYTAPSRTQIQQARALGIRAIVLGGDGWDPAHLGRDPEAIGGYLTRHWDPSLAARDSATRAFVDRFRATYGHPPAMTSALTADGLFLLADAAHRAGSLDPEKLRDALAATTAFRGVTGSIGFGARGGGDPRGTVLVVQLTADGPRVVHVVGDPATVVRE